ncbi:hypothetical protein PMAYCL1PPCAC_31651, partial [Pristionchus mayeri]
TIMASAYFFQLICATLALVHLATSIAIPVSPAKVGSGEQTYYDPPEPINPMGRLMQKEYNQSIPMDAIIACELKNAAACPSPSSDGTHRCVNIGDICDHRPQCPGAEDETPVICFFHEDAMREITRLRNYAIALFRIPPNIPRQSSQRNNGY